MKKIFQHYVSTLIGILTINPIKFTSYIPPIYWFQSIMLLEFMICHTFVTTKNITKFPCFVFKKSILKKRCQDIKKRVVFLISIHPIN